jgi:hypothetical protein
VVHLEVEVLLEVVELVEVLLQQVRVVVVVHREVVEQVVVHLLLVLRVLVEVRVHLEQTEIFMQQRHQLHNQLELVQKHL